uniref:Uncharacterized protein n=1 Tax=Micrurus paraensis TaxID=1970185 RepID=A0A2D4KAT4_9SAUR
MYLNFYSWPQGKFLFFHTHILETIIRAMQSTSTTEHISYDGMEHLLMVRKMSCVLYKDHTAVLKAVPSCFQLGGVDTDTDRQRETQTDRDKAHILKAVPSCFQLGGVDTDTDRQRETETDRDKAHIHWDSQGSYVAALVAFEVML